MATVDSVAISAVCPERSAEELSKNPQSAEATGDPQYALEELVAVLRSCTIRDLLDTAKIVAMSRAQGWKIDEIPAAMQLRKNSQQPTIPVANETIGTSDDPPRKFPKLAKQTELVLREMRCDFDMGSHEFTRDVFAEYQAACARLRITNAKHRTSNTLCRELYRQHDFFAAGAGHNNLTYLCGLRLRENQTAPRQPGAKSAPPQAAAQSALQPIGLPQSAPHQGHANICKTPLCGTHVGRKYEGYCLRCFVHLFPDRPTSRGYKTKERCVGEYLRAAFPDVSMSLDRRIVNGCSNRRPDITVDMGSHVVLVEVDENHHSGYDSSCESKRMVQLWQDVSCRPIVFIRFNPDGYRTRKGDRVKSCWMINQLGLAVVRKDQQRAWNERLTVLRNEFGHWLRTQPEKSIEVVQLYYDKGEQQSAAQNGSNTTAPTTVTTTRITATEAAAAAEETSAAVVAEAPGATAEASEVSGDVHGDFTGSLCAVVKEFFAAKEEPTVARETPTVAKKEPVAIAGETPTTAKEEPTIAGETPTTVKEEPTIAGETLTVAKKEPTAAAKKEPTVARETPTATGDKPTVIREKPVARKAPTPPEKRPPPPEKRPPPPEKRPPSPPERNAHHSNIIPATTETQIVVREVLVASAEGPIADTK